MKGHQSINYVETFYIRQIKDSQNNNSMPLVRAPLHCFFYLKKGMAKIDIGDKTYTIANGETLIVPQGQIFSVLSFEGCIGYMGGFQNNFLISNSENENIINRFEFLSPWGNPKAVFEGEDIKFIDNIFDRIYIEFTSKTIDRDIIKSYVFCLLNEINKVSDKSQPSQSSRSEEIFLKFKELIFKHIREGLSVSDYASKLNISVNHLNKIVKSLSGKSSSKWIEDAIVTEAKIMLYQTSLSVSEISETLNIFDHSYFSRLFKKSEGMTPTQFRNRVL